MTTRRLLSLAALLAALAPAGCGGDGDDGAPPSAERRPVIPAQTQVPRYAGVAAARRDPAAAGDRVLGALRVAKANASTVAPNIRGSGELTVAQFLDTMSNDVGSFWQAQFNEAGYEFEPVAQTIVQGRGQSRCFEAGFADDDSPFYCTLDPGIFYTLGFFTKQASPIGDTAIAIVVAHEWGHRVQDLLGVFRAAQAGQVTGRQVELQADCLGGVWVSTVLRRGLLEEGDLEEAVRITNAAGDAPGTPADDPRSHGSSEERVNAFLRGFRGAQPGVCRVQEF